MDKCGLCGRIINDNEEKCTVCGLVLCKDCYEKRYGPLDFDFANDKSSSLLKEKPYKILHVLSIIILVLGVIGSLIGAYVVGDLGPAGPAIVVLIAGVFLSVLICVLLGTIARLGKDTAAIRDFLESSLKK